jgi:hypothetical protein
MSSDLIHKLIKVVQSTQALEPTIYCKNHHEELHHYEQVTWSRISLVSNDRPVAFGATDKADHYG